MGDSLSHLDDLLPLEDGQISKLSHFSNIWCFFERFFAQNNSNSLVE